MEKKLYHTGFIIYAILLVLAVLFYKERTILLDNAFFLFEMVKDGSFSIQRNRFIAVLPELLPLLAIKLSMPLKAVLISYSAGFMLYHIICYALCGVLKNYRLGLALLITHTAIISHGFFWHLSELQLGISLMFPFIALAINKGRPVAGFIRYPLLLVGAAALAFSYPLMALPFAYIMVFSYFNKSVGLQNNTLSAITILFIIAAIGQNSFFFDNYGINNIENFKRLFPDYIHLYSNERLGVNILYIYYWLPLLLATVVTVYIRQREWLKLLLVTTTFGSFLLLVNVSFHGAHTPDFYRENLYTVLCVILAFPMVYDVLPLVKNRNMVFIIFVLVLASAIYRIYNIREIYRGRIDMYRGCMTETGNKKIIAPFNHRLKEPLIMEWASSYEFWLLSTVEKDTTVSIIIHTNPEEFSSILFKRKDFMTKWGLFPYKDLNPLYFKFYDTNSRYIIHEYR